VREPKTNIWTLLLAVGFALVVTALDLLARLDGVPWYAFFVIPVVWVALWSAEEDVNPLITVAVIVTVLVMIRSVVTMRTVAPALTVDRFIVVSVIWLTVLLAVLRKRARRTFRWITLAGRRWEPDKPGNQINQKDQTNHSAK
jgi:hypothetical protein